MKTAPVHFAGRYEITTHPQGSIQWDTQAMKTRQRNWQSKQTRPEGTPIVYATPIIRDMLSRIAATYGATLNIREKGPSAETAGNTVLDVTTTYPNQPGLLQRTDDEIDYTLGIAAHAAIQRLDNPGAESK